MIASFLFQIRKGRLMLADELRILITADLDPDSSKKTVNEAIRELQDTVDKLKLDIELPKDLQKTLQDFVDLTEKLKTSQEEHGKIIEKVIHDFEELDGTIK